MGVLCFVINQQTVQVGDQLTLTPTVTNTVVDSITQCNALDVGYGVFSFNSAQPTLQDIFAIPIASDLQQMFMLGFGYPIMCYLAAWGFGVLINMFNSRESVNFYDSE